MDEGREMDLPVEAEGESMVPKIWGGSGGGIPYGKSEYPAWSVDRT